jgi:N-acetylmuramoyl-L-alanine amidase
VSVKIARVLKCPNHGPLREARKGIMLHYDGSTTDPGAMAWFEHPDCKVSYNYLVLDNGDIVVVAPKNRRAWHAGACRPSGDVQYSDANSAFYGIAAATNGKTPLTEAQKRAIIALCRLLFKEEKWPEGEAWRIVGHDQECWHRGRKVDPTGADPNNPIISPAEIARSLAP